MKRKRTRRELYARMGIFLTLAVIIGVAAHVTRTLRMTDIVIDTRPSPASAADATILPKMLAPADTFVLTDETAFESAEHREEPQTGTTAETETAATADEPEVTQPFQMTVAENRELEHSIHIDTSAPETDRIETAAETTTVKTEAAEKPLETTTAAEESTKTTLVTEEAITPEQTTPEQTTPTSVLAMPFCDAAHGGVDYRVTQAFGGSNSHGGIDYGVWYGVAILAAADGKVVYAYNAGDLPNSDLRWTYGTYVVIEHENGLRTYYAHLKNRTVKVGDTVKQGEVIGYSGNTGHVLPAPTAAAPLAGTHLHFEVRAWNGNAFVRVNPALYLP